MAIALVNSGAAGFNDTNAGHVYTIPSGAAGASDLDILMVNSDTVIATPTNFTSRVDATNSQGAYIFSSYGLAGATVTLQGTPDSNCSIVWARFSGTDQFSAGGFVRADNSTGLVLPSTPTGVLAASGLLLVSFAALHHFAGGTASVTPVWTNSFTTLGAGASSIVGVNGTWVAAFGGYKLGVGTASEAADSVSWTNQASDRYGLWATFTPLAASSYVRPTLVIPPAAVHRSRSW
jgi:hypothetical protein